MVVEKQQDLRMNCDLVLQLHLCQEMGWGYCWPFNLLERMVFRRMAGGGFGGWWCGQYWFDHSGQGGGWAECQGCSGKVCGDTYNPSKASFLWKFSRYYWGSFVLNKYTLRYWHLYVLFLQDWIKSWWQLQMGNGRLTLVHVEPQ